MVDQRVIMLAYNYIDDTNIEKTEHRLFTVRDDKGNQLASLTYDGAKCFLTAFDLGKHIPELDVILDGEYAGYWLADSVNIEGNLVSAFTLTRSSWYCYTN